MKIRSLFLLFLCCIFIFGLTSCADDNSIGANESNTQQDYENSTADNSTDNSSTDTSSSDNNSTDDTNDENQFQNNIVLDLPNSYNPTKDYQWFGYTAENSGNYLFLFNYNSSSLGATIVDENQTALAHSERFGVGYKALQIFLQANQKIYIGIYDASESDEEITITVYSDNENG